MSFLTWIETPPEAVSIFLKMIVHYEVFEFNCIRFFQECFLEANYFRVVAGQTVLEFFIVGPDSFAVPLYESWATCFV